jgi:hypothetical protein
MSIAHAAGGFVGPPQNGLSGFIEELYYYLTADIIPILIAIATVVFLWGVIKYVAAGGDEDKVREGRNMMMFGVISLAVMISMWGLVALIVKTINIDQSPIPVNVFNNQ